MFTTHQLRLSESPLLKLPLQIIFHPLKVAGTHRLHGHLFSYSRALPLGTGGRSGSGLGKAGDDVDEQMKLKRGREKVQGAQLLKEK